MCLQNFIVANLFVSKNIGFGFISNNFITLLNVFIGTFIIFSFH